MSPLHPRLEHLNMASSVGGQIGDAGSQNGKGLRFWAAFGAVAITGLAASLDAVTLSVALPVRLSLFRWLRASAILK